jgi:hypothetical protein
MKVTDDLIEGTDISLKRKGRFLAISSSASLNDLLHVVCVYMGNPHLTLEKGVVHLKATKGQYAHETEGYLDLNLYYDIASKEATLVMIGSPGEKFNEFSNSLLKIDGMKDAQNGQ